MSRPCAKYAVAKATRVRSINSHTRLRLSDFTNIRTCRACFSFSLDYSRYNQLRETLALLVAIRESRVSLHAALRADIRRLGWRRARESYPLAPVASFRASQTSRETARSRRFPVRGHLAALPCLNRRVVGSEMKRTYCIPTKRKK